MPRHPNTHRSHHKPAAHTKTHTVTNTKLAIAVMAAILAGGLAYAASGRQERNQCTMTRIEFVGGESCRRNKYKGVEYTCSNGTTGNIEMRKCHSASKLQKSAERKCARIQCVREETTQTNTPVDTSQTTNSITNTNTTPDLTTNPTDTTRPIPVEATPTSESLLVTNPTTSLPDLTISLLRFSEDKKALFIRVENIGTAVSESIPSVDGAVRFEWRGEASGSTQSVESRELSLSRLQPGEHVEMEVRLPQDFTPTQLYVQVDGQNKMIESNENNNLRMEEIKITL